MKRRWATMKAFGLILLIRLLLRLPDALIARLIGWAAFFARVFGASEDTKKSIDEARRIFIEGGAGSQTVRKMLHDGDPKRLRMIVRGIFLY
jgi:hypothetical protein